MADVIVSFPASLDTDRILIHLQRHAGPSVAIQFRFDFRAVYRRLADHPESGAARSNLGRGVRLVTVHPYVVLHRYDRAADTVFILRILHGRRNPSLDAT